MVFPYLNAVAQQQIGQKSILFFFVLNILGLALYLLYRAALPKPIPGIPYCEASAHHLLGDVPSMQSHIRQTDGTFITYIIELMRTLDAPLIQVFIRPFGKPLLILADFQEAHDLLIHRKDFDRSDTLGDLVKGLAPDHHIHLKTNSKWKMQRRLVQDLMTPSFLHNVAGPAIHQNAVTLIALWRAKCKIASGRPWVANEDIIQVALDAVMAFAFGEKFRHSMTKPTLDAVMDLGSDHLKTMGNKEGIDEPVSFPKGPVDEVIQATLDLTKTVGEVQGNPFPSLTWAYVMRKPWVKRATKIKENFIMEELKDAVEKLREGNNAAIQSAVDHLVVREKGLAEKNGRRPDYFSRVMIDEVFGFIFAGHETTSTTICWALKFLADNPAAQTKLRMSLQKALEVAASESRDPTIQGITSTSMPYLDAVIEETLRCAGTAPVVDRQATADTELLGHIIPKGTVVTCLVTGASMMSAPFPVEDGLRSQTSQSAQKEGRQRAWDTDGIYRFQPERWLTDNGEFEATAGPQLAFGLGTRGCYGKRLVYLEMRILLTLVVWNFELLPCPPGLSGYKSALVTTNEPKDCYVRLREIHS